MNMHGSHSCMPSFVFFMHGTTGLQGVEEWSEKHANLAHTRFFSLLLCCLIETILAILWQLLLDV